VLPIREDFLISRLFAVLIIAIFSLCCTAQEITVAAASDLSFALREIATKFHSQTGVNVKLTFGSSGNFFTAIQNGAPYDVFFSADVDYPRRLEAAGLVEPGTLYEYAVGKLVLWVPANSKLDLNRGLAVLADPSIRKIAIANPRHAPYGRAALAALHSAGIYGEVAQKLVTGENIAQTAQFVQSGNADIGIVALSLAVAPNMSTAGRYSRIREDTYPPIQQAAIMVKSAKDKAAARRFMDFVKSADARQILARYGFVSGPR
jgi:molybdate transport system substrate-binding protein